MEFKCWLCGGVFENSWTEEEAIAEMKANFGEGITVEECESLCDECYSKTEKGFKNAQR